jgi:hypothetical protein
MFVLQKHFQGWQEADSSTSKTHRELAGFFSPAGIMAKIPNHLGSFSQDVTFEVPPKRMMSKRL